jgi:hypothetical protein
MASEAGNSTSPAGRLVEFCLRSACRDKHSVAIWRRQRRTLARLPSQLAEPLFHRLLHSHLLTPPLLELFQHSIEDVDLSGELSVDAEWMAYIGGFHHLHILRATDCRSLTNNALWHLVGVISLLCFTITMHGNKQGLYLIQAILQSGIPGIGWSIHICRNTQCSGARSTYCCPLGGDLL